MPARFEWLRALAIEIPGVVITHFSFEAPFVWALRMTVDGELASLTWATANMIYNVDRRGFPSAAQLVRLCASFARRSRGALSGSRVRP